MVQHNYLLQLLHLNFVSDQLCGNLVDLSCVKLWRCNCLTEWIFTPWFYAPMCYINECIDHWINTSWDPGLCFNGLLCHMIPSISALIPSMSPGLGVEIKSYGLSGLHCTIFTVTVMGVTESVSQWTDVSLVSEDTY